MNRFIAGSAPLRGAVKNMSATEWRAPSSDRMGRRPCLTALLAIALATAGWTAPAGADAIRIMRLQAILDAFAQQGHEDQATLIAQALDASPQLLGQFNTSAYDGRLSAIEIATPNPKQRPTPFPGTMVRSKLILAPDFIARQKKQQLQEFLNAGEILPDNLVFALGTLIHYGDTPPVVAGPHPPANLKAAAERDARAFINGWNVMIDAATRENRGKPLSFQQVNTLLLNLRDRVIFANENVFGRYRFSPGGTIQTSQENVDAIAAGLGRIGLLEIGVAPGQ